MTTFDASSAQPRDKSADLLAFLKDEAAIRRKPVSSYGAADQVLWFGDLPKDRAECQSPFISDKPDELGASWLEVRKRRMPVRPPVPRILEEWVRPEDLDQAGQEPKLLAEIQTLVERRAPNPDATLGGQSALFERVSEQRRLSDHPEVEEAWIEYFVQAWDPWSEEIKRWQAVQAVYEKLDRMRRRLEEAEERYELLLGIGFLQWRDPNGKEVGRHVLTAPAELTLDAGRGLLTVEPAASFECLRVELDMLDLQHRPRLKENSIDEQLRALDIRAWDAALMMPILREIANSLSPDAQVDETIQRSSRAHEQPHLTFAPALVLRERQPTAYDDLIRKLHEAAASGALEPTAPWLRLIREGEAPSASTGVPSTSHAGDVNGPGACDRLLFPLPTNEEQRQIVDRLKAQPCVLVKGPPGTGKSHTIANLICHLLAAGERVLVTAHAAKALKVLKDLLPEKVRPLSITALGSSLEDQRLLEDSVREILRMKSEWPGPEAAEKEIEQAEHALGEVEGQLATTERDLRAFREAETHSHHLSDGYSGTAAQIARAVHEHEKDYSWLSTIPPNETFPLDAGELSDLIAYHQHFTADVAHALGLNIGAGAFPSPDEFEALIDRVVRAEKAAERHSQRASAAKREVLDEASSEFIGELRKAISTLEDFALKSERLLGEVSSTVLEDLLSAADERWIRQEADSATLGAEAARLLQAIGSASVELPSDLEESRLKADVSRRLAHFEAGGRKGFWVFAPEVVKETRYVVKRCRLDGRSVGSVERLKCVQAHLELLQRVRMLRDLWGGALAKAPEPKHALTQAEVLTNHLKALLDYFQSQQAETVVAGLGSNRTILASAEGREGWTRAIDSVMADREARDARRPLEDLLGRLTVQEQGASVHRCMREMVSAVRARDTAAWRRALEERERVEQERAQLAHYLGLVERLGAVCPELADEVNGSSGDPIWQARLAVLRDAWSWGAALTWLSKVSDASAHEQRVQDHHRLRQKVEKTTEKLVALRAWKAFFDRLDDRVVQSLNAWTRAVSRIGKGTGKHAYLHRRTARQYLLDCVPTIPAWVMPLHKLWDSIDAMPGLFDTIIVDEASQAGVNALALLLLAKRIIVVGDDKQNSPEAIGVLEDDIARLARMHLDTFRFRDEFRPDTSLFDHAERTFGSQITLREHFRCMPEIIRFSNALCYTDAPLIPLRQAPPDRLRPLCQCFVEEGACEGEAQRIRNRAEAEALVSTVVELIADDAYDGKSMGVITLQGQAQADVIAKLLAQRLDPRVIEERKLRCGDPATFQGDARDIVFLSLVIAPNVKYRALSRLPDKRRFNVAMSRAKDQVWLFHSVKQHDLGPDDLRRRLIDFFDSPRSAELDALFEDLERLERQARSARRLGNQPEPYDSWFEVDVAIELLRRRFKVRPQVEVAGRRIDLVIEGIDARLAVECDGDTWHGPEQYEHDMARQRQLERAGWTFVRVRESDFYVNRERAIQAVMEACKELSIRTADFADEPTPGSEPRESAASIDEPSAYAIATDSEQQPKGSEGAPDVSTSTEGPFTGYSEALGFPDPREASQSNVREIIRGIVDRDGPLTRASIYRLYVEGCPGLRRVGKIVRQALNRAIGAMLRAGEIVQEDELGDGSPESQVIRVSGRPEVSVRPAGARDMLEIPPSELLAVARLRQPSGSLLAGDEAAVYRALLEHYGFNRLTLARRKYLAKVLLRRADTEAIART